MKIHKGGGGNMIRLKRAVTVLGCTESYRGKLHDCRIMIGSVDPEFALENKTWYYVISKRGFSYNSSLDRIMFESKENCNIAAENKVEKLVLANFPEKENNVYCSSFRYYKLFRGELYD